MTPQNVIICAFAFACVIIVGGGLIFGGKRHASTARDASTVAALENTPTKSEPQVAKPEATKAEATEPQATKAEVAKPDAAKPDAVKPEAAKPEATLSKPPESAAATPDRAQSLPIVASYEFKRKRETDKFIARDPKGFWIRQIVSKIEDKKIELPKPLEQPVAVQLEFVIGRDGALRSKAVRKSSGSEEADKTAIAMLEHAQPFPPMPEGLPDQELTFNLPVRFR